MGVASQCVEDNADNKRLMKNAACAADIGQIVAATNALALSGVNMRETCSAKNLKSHYEAVVQMTRGGAPDDEEHAKKMGHMHNLIHSELSTLANTKDVIAAHTDQQEVAAKSRPVHEVMHARDDISTRLQSLSQREGVVV